MPLPWTTWSMVECSPEFSQYLSQNFPNIFVAAISAGEIGVKSVASEQALGICTFWQSGLPDYTCSEWIISFIEALLKYGVIVDAECHLHACQNFLVLDPTLAIHTHMSLWSWQNPLSVPLDWFVLSFCPIWGWLTYHFNPLPVLIATYTPISSFHLLPWFLFSQWHVDGPWQPIWFG